MDENTEKQVETTETTTAQQPEGETLEQLKTRLADADKRIKELNHENADRRKKLDAFEQTEQKRKEAEMTETERLKAELERERGDRLKALREAVAAKVGLPETLADRLRGDTREELEADAKAILETLPKQPKTTTLAVTNPGMNGQPAETRDQKKARLMGQNPDIWAKGGGVQWDPTMPKE